MIALLTALAIVAGLTTYLVHRDLQAAERRRQARALVPQFQNLGRALAGIGTAALMTPAFGKAVQAALAFEEAAARLRDTLERARPVLTWTSDYRARHRGWGIDSSWMTGPQRCVQCRHTGGYVKSGGPNGMLQQCSHPPRHRLVDCWCGQVSDWCPRHGTLR